MLSSGTHQLLTGGNITLRISQTWKVQFYVGKNFDECFISPENIVYWGEQTAAVFLLYIHH